MAALDEEQWQAARCGFQCLRESGIMRAGTAVAGFLQPAMTIVGTAHESHSALLRELYSWVPGRFFETSFPLGDDRRESPRGQLVKQLLGEGRSVIIWDDKVSLGRLKGSNRDYIQHAIPHIGSLLVSDLEQCLKVAEVAVMGSVPREHAQKHLRPDLNLEKSRRPALHHYEGICW